MGIFQTVLTILRQSQGFPELKNSYKKIHEISKLLEKEIIKLKKEESIIINERIKNQALRSTKPVGIGHKKSVYIDEELLSKDKRKLERLANLAENNIIVADKKIHLSQPIPPSVQAEIKAVVDLLEKSKTELRDIKTLSDDPDIKLTQIQSVLRTITKLHEEYYEREKYLGIAKSKLLQMQISKLVNEIYDKSYVEEFDNGLKLTVFRLSLHDLSSFIDDSKAINEAQDPDYKIIWRDWWADKNRLMLMDQDQSIRKNGKMIPHKNVEIILGPKKDKKIHLILV